jgi:hypothetical protein
VVYVSDPKRATPTGLHAPEAAARNKCFTDRRLAARDEANGPVYLIAASFVDYFLIHYKNDLHTIGEFWARGSISRQIPC